MVFRIAVIGYLTTLSWATQAANIELHNTESGIDIIAVTGELLDGDSRDFNDVAVGLDSAIVVFDSPGGLMKEGLAIGRTIYIKGFDTAVGDQALCASSCGLAWLAGRQKFLYSSSKVGFHAIYEPDTAQSVSSAGNALVGAYLHQLGFSDELIVYATETNPSLMRWLNLADAMKLRIDVTVLDEPDTPSTISKSSDNQSAIFPPSEAIEQRGAPKLRKLSDEADASTTIGTKDFGGNPTGTLYDVK